MQHSNLMLNKYWLSFLLLDNCLLQKSSLEWIQSPKVIELRWPKKGKEKKATYKQ